jgi:hypothetical protein
MFLLDAGTTIELWLWLAMTVLESAIVAIMKLLSLVGIVVSVPGGHTVVVLHGQRNESGNVTTPAQRQRKKNKARLMLTVMWSRCRGWTQRIVT